VARDRKRAKQRRVRRGGRAQAERPQPERSHSEAARAASAPGGGSVLGGIERADLPGALEHAGDVDEFDAALIRGAQGVPAVPDTESDGAAEREAAAEDRLQTEALAAGADGKAPPGDELAQASGAPIRRGNRAIGFLRASWAELQRVQWPDRRQVFQATAVVLGFVAIAGVYLGLADLVAKEIVEFIL
jgi:preprotein translocase subunit SecE